MSFIYKGKTDYIMKVIIPYTDVQFYLLLKSFSDRLNITEPEGGSAYILPSSFEKFHHSFLISWVAM